MRGFCHVGRTPASATCSAMEIRALHEGDDRSQLRSGDPDLDRFFRRFAGQSQFRHHLGITYVAVDAGRILGFATVAPGHVEIDGLPATARRKLPRDPLPLLRLARLAVDQAARGQGLGRQLLRFVFQLALRMARDYGCVGVAVDAKPYAVDSTARVPPRERCGSSTTSIVACPCSSACSSGGCEDTVQSAMPGGRRRWTFASRPGSSFSSTTLP